MPDVSNGLLLVFASASVFGPLSGWLAAQRVRNIPIWAVFGVILGPIALALLMSAPPGRCAACRWPVAGWGARCAACGADLRTGALAATDTEVPATDTEVPATPGWPAGFATASPTNERREGPVAFLGAAPALSIGTDAEAGAGQVWRAPQAPSRDGLGIAAAEPDGDRSPRVAPTQLGHRPLRSPSVDLVEHAAEGRAVDAPMILGTGVYVGGSRPIQRGSRYLLARVSNELQILGPVHLDLTTIADRMPLAAVEAFVLDERLIIDSRDKKKFDVSMAFVAVSLQRGVDIQAALGALRSAAPPE